MKLIADLHIHSRYSRATSKELSAEEIDYWARLKGLNLVGTGDFTHPQWRAELKQKLTEAEPGLYQLKEKYRIQNRILPLNVKPMRFIFSTELSCIYKKAGSVRKLHHLILAPNYESAERLSKRLSQIGNLEADGRPILGIDSKHLLELILETEESAVLIPAHIWTPWFSLFGSMSGFDALEECFEELGDKIFALETGLSSDPKMNWRLSSLDQFSLVSNSDAHSVKNLGREANIFNCEMDYNSLIRALREPEEGFLGTVEFFPEEGKYHFDGHRKCGVCFSPRETKRHQGLCPKCGRALTIGVMNRVEELADREEPQKPQRAPGYKSLIPLAEVLGEIMGAGSQSKGVEREYFRLISRLGPELEILLELPLSEIEKEFPTLAIAVQRMREGKVKVEPGYDGEYGRIKVFEEEELEKLARRQNGFFAVGLKGGRKSEREDVQVQEVEQEILTEPRLEKEGIFVLELSGEGAQALAELNLSQRKAVESKSRLLLIKAGPGTGKTRTLTHRIAYLIETGKAEPEQVLALTFTNQAGEEMRSRLKALLGEKAERIWVSTFHSFALRMLKEFLGREEDFFVIDDAEGIFFLKKLREDFSESKLKQTLEQIRRAKMLLLSPEQVKGREGFSEEFARIYERYQELLLKEQSLDFEDLLFRLVEAFAEEGFARKLRERFRFIFVDEYQDLDFAQDQLVKLLVGETGTLCAIGDPDQSIYGFRGASPEFFEKFREQYPGAELIELSQSFRSSEQILSASLQVLSPEERRELKSDKQGPKLKIIEQPTERAEAEFVISEIEKLLGGVGFFSLDSSRVASGVQAEVKSFSEIAVLFRTMAQAEALLEAFSRSGIPYQIFSESPLLSKFFKTSLRVLQLLSGISSPALIELSFSEIFKKAESYPEKLSELPQWLKGMSDPPAEIFLELLQSAKELSALEILDKIFSLLPAGPEESSEKELVKNSVVQLVERKVKETGLRTPKELWECLRFASGQDFYDPRGDRVSLLTIHSAKGLEFEVVFLVGCEEGILPHISARREKELEEEARLFYVAMTRAKRLLYLSYAKKRVLGGILSEQRRSRFLERIEKGLWEFLKPEFKPFKPKAKQLGLFEG